VIHREAVEEVLRGGEESAQRSSWSSYLTFIVGDWRGS
jgi:hypothetical protein